MEKLYTLVIEGKPKGPFTLEELKQKSIKPDSFVRTADMDDYKEAHELEELRAFLGFQENYTPPQYFAGFDLRLLASAIDWFILFGITALVQLAIILYLDDRESTIFIITIGLAILPFIKTIYQITTEHLYQASFGKKLLQIKVCDLRGLKPSFTQILIRNLGKAFSSLILFFGYLYLFLNKQQQTLHDKFANTLVVKDRLI